MRIHYVLDEGLAHPMQTGVGQDTVASLQSAVKYLVKSKEVMACDVNDIEVYPLGVTRQNYEEATPLKPEDKLPSGSTKANAIFVHVPHEKQVLNPEEREIQTKPSAAAKKKKADRLAAMSDKVNPKAEEPKPAVKRVYKDSYIGGQHLTDEEKCDIPKFMCYYQLGESVPYYIEVQGWEKTVGRLKERILETRGNRGLCPDLWGVTDITKFKAYPPGRDQYGKPKHPELDDYDAHIPTNSTYEDPIIIPAVRNTEEEDKAKEALRKAKEKKKRKSKQLKPKKEKPKTITVQVKTPDGKLIPVALEPSNAIQLLKEKVAPEAGVAVPKQVLHFNGTELPNEKTAADMGLVDGSVVELQPTPITVHVKMPDGKTISVQMDPFDSIQSIKENIAPECGIDVPQQVLKFDGNELPNEETADGAGLVDGSVLDLSPKGITVHVKTPEGETISVQLDPTDTIESIKQAVEEPAGIAVPQQILKFEDKELPNEETAEGVGLVDGSVLDLSPKGITVHVKTPEGETISVQLDPSDTIKSIKLAVEEPAGIAVPKQVLKFEGEELPNEETADGAGLVDGSILDLSPKDITVHVRTPDGKTISVLMDPSDTIESIKQSVEEPSGIAVPQQVLKFDGKLLPDEQTADGAGLVDGSVLDLSPKGITVHVKTPDGKTISVPLSPLDTIESIKKSVEEPSGIALPQQVLKFDGKELPNEDTADGSGLVDGSILDLSPQDITVHVKTPDGKTISVQMSPLDSIESIKQSVEEPSGIAVPQQVLKFEGNELPSEETAAGAGLVDGSILDLSPKDITVHVRTPDGKTISVQLDPSDTVESIKQSVEEPAGIAVPKQVLKFDGKELSNNETADGAGLVDGSILDLSPKDITVHVKTPDGKTISVQMDPSDTIQSIKQSVEEPSGIAVPKQVLKFEGKELSNDQTADGAGLVDGSILDLSPKNITVNVRCPDGKILTVDMDPTDTVQSIKEAVATPAGVEVPKQVLKFEGADLPDDETAEAVGLKDGSTIDLETMPTPEDDAEAKYKEKKAKKEKKKKKKSKDKDWELDKPKEYSHEFNPTPMDLTRHKAHFMVGDQVPMEMICPSGLTIQGFKEEIWKMRNEGSTIVKRYFAGISDYNRLKIYPAGSWGEGTPLPDHILVPRDSSPYAMFWVVK